MEDLTGCAIIAGEAGIGKTAMLTTYSFETDSLWNVRINLNYYEAQIEKANFSDLNGIAKFMSNIINSDSSVTSLIEDLLKYSLNLQDRVTLLLDGFDEVKCNSQSKVVQLLKTLKTTKGRAVITTRSYARFQLEEALNIFAYILNPFNETEQNNFLKQFWITRLGIKEQVGEEKISEFTKQIVRERKGLVGIVLQARMVAEIFEDNCKEYLKTDEFDTSKYKINNTFDLYEMFIQRQYKRYLEEKIGIRENLSDSTLDLLGTAYTREHGYYALKSLFSKDQILELLSKTTIPRNELQGVGLIKSFRDDWADFLHPSYAEYFAAHFFVDALQNEKDSPVYRTVDNFLRLQIFKDKNEVIRNFISDNISKKINTYLNSNWKAIQDRVLLGKIGTENLNLNLMTVSLSEISSDSIPSVDILPERSLSDLQKDVENCMRWRNDGMFFYIGDVNWIYNLYAKFVTVTDIKALKPVLKFLLNASGKSLNEKARDVFSVENNAYIIKHFLTRIKEENENIIAHVDKELLQEIIIKGTQKGEHVLGILNQKGDLIDSFILKEIKKRADLIDLSNLYYIVKEFYPIDIKINENIREQYILKIINSLNISFYWAGSIHERMKNAWHFESLQSFYADILYSHPRAISMTKSYVNKMYEINTQNKSFTKKANWLERQGVLISRVLNILTPEMSKWFIESLVNHVYSNAVFVDLINYFVNSFRIVQKEEEFENVRLKVRRVDNLPHVDKLAFLKMLVQFVNFSWGKQKQFPLTCKQLAFVDYVLHEQRQHAVVASEVIEYLFVLGQSGMMVIDTEEALIVLDPKSGYECKIGSEYKDQLIQIIEWKKENVFKSPFELLKECYVILEYKKRRINRQQSEVPTSKKLKTAD